MTVATMKSSRSSVSGSRLQADISHAEEYAERAPRQLQLALVRNLADMQSGLISNRTPFYHLCPKDPAEQVEYRRCVRRAAAQDPKFRATLRAMCQRDILFWLNTFCFVFEPRNADSGGIGGLPAVLPFNTMDFQDEAILAIDAAVGRHDLVIPKARDMTVSWSTLAVFTHRWQFRKHQSFILMSYKEDLVDKPDDPKSLFSKVDFLLEHQPTWLVPPDWNKVPNRTFAHLLNPVTKSVINGESTTARSSTGARCLAILLDEFSKMIEAGRILTATRDVTKSRFFVFTPEGKGHPSYKLFTNPKIKKLVLNWWQHPQKRPGLYTSVDGQLKIIDKTYNFPADYVFVLDGTLRSPAYDAQEARCNDPREMAKEWRLDFGAADYVFFPGEILDTYKAQCCRPPVSRQGLAKFLSNMPADFWDRIGNASLDLWMHADAHGKLPGDRRYVLALDVAAGTGASNSVLVLYDAKTREKVAEFASPHIMAHELAQLAFAVAKWAKGPGDDGALIIWEQNGPGRAFGTTLTGMGYLHVYYNRNEASIARKPTDTPGWMPTVQNKRAVLEAYKGALYRREIGNFSEAAIEDCRPYVYAADGSVVHTNAAQSDDPTGARANHGDRAIADGLAWWLLRDDASDQEVPAETEVTHNCPYTRRQEWEQARRREKAW